MTPLVVGAAVIAGAAGSVVRYLVARAFARQPTRLPWAVLIVNVAGSFAAGIGTMFTTSFVLDDPSVTLIVVSGFAGGLTTFSTLSTETVQLISEKRARIAIMSVLANFVLGVTAFLIGFFGTLAVISAMTPSCAEGCPL